MNAKDVLAVVVSYNGLHKTRRTVDALRGQVGHVHIVDNGSAAESLNVLDVLEQEPGITVERLGENRGVGQDRKSTRLNSSHTVISYAVFCLKKKKKKKQTGNTAS